MDLDDLLNEVEAAISTGPNTGPYVGQALDPIEAPMEMNCSYNFLNNNKNKLEHSKSLETNYNSPLDVSLNNGTFSGHRNSQSFHEYSQSSGIVTKTDSNSPITNQFTDMYKGSFISENDSPIAIDEKIMIDTCANFSARLCYILLVR